MIKITPARLQFTMVKPFHPQIHLANGLVGCRLLTLGAQIRMFSSSLMQVDDGQGPKHESCNTQCLILRVLNADHSGTKTIFWESMACFYNKIRFFQVVENPESLEMFRYFMVNRRLNSCFLWFSKCQKVI